VGTHTATLHAANSSRWLRGPATPPRALVWEALFTLRAADDPSTGGDLQGTLPSL
jgi:hypothetical protein